MKQLIDQNAERLRQLKSAVDEAARHRSAGVSARLAWEAACEEYHRRYDELAFPGGLQKGLQLIEAGDSLAVETALLYLELRPFFFGAQYQRIAFTKRLKRLSLAQSFRTRLEAVVIRLHEWRIARRHPPSPRPLQPAPYVMPRIPDDAPKPEFEPGQCVRVILNERNRTPHQGVIAERDWHFRQRKWLYFLTEAGKPVKKRYFAEDIEPGGGDLECPHSPAHD